MRDKQILDDVLHTLLQAFFKFDSFREGQLPAINCLLQNQDLLAVMPTGSGKSLIFQLASLLMPGTTIIISPLISLMKDQVDKLNQRHIQATFINSTLSSREKQQRLREIVDGKYKLVYVAPERLRQFFFREEIANIEVGLLVVDEAHCISQWGHDFRPDYLHIPAFRELVGNPVTAAFTATAAPRVRGEIEKLLKLRNNKRILLGFDRPNIKFESLLLQSTWKRHKQKLAILAELFANWQGEATIVYVGTRRDAETVAWFIKKRLGLPAACYHGGMEKFERDQVQEAFVSGDLPITVATNAFGMGIDRPDVRMVIHHTIPGSLEAYYQEAGRAGRDGQPARAILLYNPTDRALQEYFIENSQLQYSDLRQLYQTLARKANEMGEVWIKPDDISRQCGFDEEDVRVRVGLQRLEEAGALEQIHVEGIEHFIVLNEWQKKQVRAVVAKIDAHCDWKRVLLEEMICYAENEKGCRRNVILRYFGENSPSPGARRNCCDVCDNRRDIMAFFTEIQRGGNKVSAPPPDIRATILDCVETFAGLRSEEQLVALLKGNLKGYSRFKESRYHGMLSSYPVKQIKQNIRQLLAEDILTEGAHGKLFIAERVPA